MNCAAQGTRQRRAALHQGPVNGGRIRSFALLPRTVPARRTSLQGLTTADPAFAVITIAVSGTVALVADTALGALVAESR
ncbi:hypothetical protein ACFV5G_06430 [Streptomyces sp. NPDC059766]|uniref:hypothetical protein n=1 Tax=Streptomyces sp. NPDC059766 TaxID=3346940 RepID=UPI00365DBA1F